MEERIELRAVGGKLLGVLVGGTAIEIRRGLQMHMIDLVETAATGVPVIRSWALWQGDPGVEFVRVLGELDARGDCDG